MTDVSGCVHNRTSDCNAYNMQVSDCSLSPENVMGEMDEQSGNGEVVGLKRCIGGVDGRYCANIMDQAASAHGSSQVTVRRNVCMVEDEKVIGMNLDYCKGCGVCAYECPGKKGVKAIKMEEEAKFLME